MAEPSIVARAVPGPNAHAWWSAACAGAVAVAAVGPGWALTSVVFVIGALSPLAILAGIRRWHPRRGPWQAVAMVTAALWAGYAVTILGEVVAGRPLGYPSGAEAFNLLAYVFALVGIGGWIRLRTHVNDPTNLLDAGILVAGVGQVTWVWVVAPHLFEDSASGAAKAVDLLFTVLALAAVGGIARLAIGPGARNASWYYQAGAVAASLVNEVTLSASGSYTEGALGRATLVASAALWVCAGAAGLHPSMAQTTEPATEPVGRMSRRRLAMTTGAVLVGPAIVAVDQHLTTASLVGLLIGWAAVTTLVMVRVAGLVRARERLADVDRVVATAASRLVAAEDRASAEQAALGAIVEIAGEGDVVVAAVATLYRRSLELTAAYPEALTGSAVATRALADLEAWGSATQSARCLGGVAWSAADGAAEVWLVPLGTQGNVHAVLLLATREPLPRPARDALVAVGRLLSLGLESVATIARTAERRSEERLQLYIEQSADLVVVYEPGGRPVFVSPAAARLAGLGPDERDRFDLVALAHPGDRRVAAELIEGRRAGEPHELRLGADGTWGWYEVVVTPLSTELGDRGQVVTAREVGDRKRAEATLAASEARFRSLVQHSSDLIAIIDTAAVVSYVSPSVQHLLGTGPTALVERSFCDVLHADDHAPFLKALGALGHRGPATVEVRARAHPMSWRTLAVTIADLRDEPSVAGIVLNAHDITEQKLLEASLRHQALHDDLTGLGNRVLFRDAVNDAVERDRHGHVCVLLIDLDDFKTINDSLGHAVGDHVLEIVAQRLRQALRHEDIAARLGGDEFGVLLPDVHDPDEAQAIATRILGVVSAPVVLFGRELSVTATIGAVFSAPGERHSAEVLLRNADAAMYYGKNRGKDRIECFDEQMHISAIERLELKTDLDGAVERGELHVHYQPIIDLSTTRATGFEALLRWRHPSRGIVSPAAFIPIAEETGRIVSIGRWVLRVALTQLAEWHRATAQPNLSMSVNLSARQLDEPDLPRQVAEALGETGIPPHLLTLEITESRAVASERAMNHLMALRAMGVGLAADDFGTGEASYAALQRLPFSTLKIDRSIVSGLGDSHRPQSNAHVASILELARGTGRTCVAEGVEHGEQAATLRSLGCPLAQGFYFARPMEPGAATQWLGVREAGRTGIAAS